jgi:hypothetical protein
LSLWIKIKEGANGPKKEKKTKKFHVLKLVIKDLDLDPDSPKSLDRDSGERGYDNTA